MPTEKSRILTAIPRETVVGIYGICDELLRTILEPSGERRTFEFVVKRIRELFAAEGCAIFTSQPGSTRYIQLRAYNFRDERKPVVRPSYDPILVESQPRRGLTAHLADKKTIQSMSRVDVLANEFHSSRPASFLPSAQCYSLLAIPILDRKKRLLGLIKVENKFGSNSGPGDEIQFDPTDIEVATVLREQIAEVLQRLAVVDLYRELIKDMQNSSRLSQMIDVVLSKAKEITFADRVDLALWSHAKQQLVIAGSAGENPKTLSKWAVAPEPSVIRAVWNNVDTAGVVIPDVASQPLYFDVSHEKTKSQMTICMEVGGRPIGVLSAESYQLDAFDAIDLEAFQIVARNSALALQTVGEKSQIQGHLRPQEQEKPSEALLNLILRCALAQYSLSEGMIYIANFETSELVCQAFQSVAQMTADFKKFKYSFNFEDSAATWIFREKRGLYSPNPSIDTRFHLKGIEFFGIQGPWVGIPLIYGERVVGVLGVWNSSLSSESDSMLTPSLVNELAPFGKLAAAHIAGCGRPSERATDDFENPGVHDSDDELSKLDYLRLIAIGVHAAGFERARVFRYSTGKAGFIHVASLGHPIGHTTSALIQSPYTKHVELTYLSNPCARIYDPTDPTMFGTDPYAQTWDRDPQAAWAVVPIIVAGELVGQIAADLNSEITSQSLEYLTLTGTLVSQELAKARQRQRVDASENLYRSLLDYSDAFIFRKDVDGRFTFMNRRMCDLFGMPWSAIQGKTDFDLLPQKEAEDCQVCDYLAVSQGFFSRDEVLTNPRDGQRLHFHVSKLPVYNSKRKLIGVQGICWDIGDQVEREQHLRAMVDEKTAALQLSVRELLHNVRNNLSIVKHYITELIGKTQDSTLAEDLKELEHRIGVMSAIRDEIYLHSTAARVNGQDFFHSLVHRIAESLGLKSLRFSAEGSFDSLPFKVASRCGLIVNELVFNAFKYAFPEGREGEIWVLLKACNLSEFVLVVKDNGIGMASQNIVGRNDDSLGLSIVRDWVATLDGRMSINSSDSQGTEIKIWVPYNDK